MRRRAMGKKRSEIWGRDSHNLGDRVQSKEFDHIKKVSCAGLAEKK